jgi:hypothetical protein
MEENQRLIDLFLSVFLYFLSQIKVILAFVIIGIVLGLGLVLNSQKKYDSVMAGFSAVAPSAVYLSILDPLSLASQEKNHTLLAELLNIDLEVASSIKGIQFESTTGNRETLDLDKNFEQNSIDIIVTTTQPESLEIIEQGILQFLSTNAYLTSKVQLRIDQVDRTITGLENKISFIDSAQLLSMRLLATGKVTDYLSLSTSTLTPEGESVLLQKTLEENIILRKQLKSFVVVSSLKNSVTKSESSALKMAIISILSLVAALLFIAFRRLFQLARQENVKD